MPREYRDPKGLLPNTGEPNYGRSVTGDRAPIMETPKVTEMEKPKVEEIAATSIIWNDDQEGGVGQGIHQADAAVSNKPNVTQDEITPITQDEVVKNLQGKTDTALIKDAAPILGNANNKKDAFAGLKSAIESYQGGIDNAERRRDAMKLLAFGAAMLSGEGMARATSIANSVGGFNEQHINELYKRRGNILKQLEDREIETTLGPSTADLDTEVFGDTYVDQEGNEYFKYKNRPGYEGPKGSVRSLPSGAVKQGTKSFDLPSHVQNTVNKYDEKADTAEQEVYTIETIIQGIDEYGGQEGWAGILAETTKGIFGWEGGTSTWKTKFNNIRLSEALKNKPPGAISNKEIGLLLDTVPDSHWDKQTLRKYLVGAQKAREYQIEYNRAKANFLATNRGGSLKKFEDEWKKSDEYKNFWYKDTGGVKPSDKKATKQTRTTSTGVTYTIE